MKTLLAFVAAGTLALLNSTANAATFFLNVPSITGEDPVPGYPGAMSLKSLTFSPKHYSVTKNVDSTSVTLAHDVVLGTNLHTTTVLVYKGAPTATPNEMLVFPN